MKKHSGINTTPIGAMQSRMVRAGFRKKAGYNRDSTCGNDVNVCLKAFAAAVVASSDDAVRTAIRDNPDLVRIYLDKYT